MLDLIPAGTPTLLIANKLDRVGDKDSLFPFMQQMSALRDFREIVPLSAKHPEDIKRLMSVIKPYLPEGEPIYGEDDLTDRSERFLAAEILREKVFRWTGDELPYTSTVLIDKFETEGRLRRVFATILVDRDTHKAMIIGQKGAKLKQISTRGATRHGEAFRWPRVSRNLRQGEERLGGQRSGPARIRLRVMHGRRLERRPDDSTRR